MLNIFEVFLVLISRAGIIEYHQLGDLSIRNTSFHSSGSSKSKIRAESI